MPTPAYIPNASDAVWLEFDTQAGHEKAGHRPALVVSPANYNRKTGLMVCCPMSTKSKAHPFEVVTQVIRSNVLVQNGLGLHHLGSRLCAHCDPFERLLNWQEYFFQRAKAPSARCAEIYFCQVCPCFRTKKFIGKEDAFFARSKSFGA